MKTSSLNSTKGSVLLSASMTAGVLAILIAGFLTYLSNEYNLNMRTHRWNQSFHLGEAAVEVGFAEFNYQYSQGGSGFTSGRGWTDLGGGSYTKTVSSLTDASGNTVGTLKVTAIGVGGSNPQIQGEGTVSSSNYGGPSIARAVRVSLTGSTQFPYGLTAKSRIDMQGQGVIDSFDSSDPSKSTGGLYDLTKRQTNGDVVTTTNSSNAVNNGLDVYGKITTASGGTVTMSGGSVGATTVSSQRSTTTADGVAKGWILNSANITIPDASLPSGLGSASSLGAIGSTTTINAGDWQASSINLSSSKTLTVQGTVRLYVTGTITVSGNASIVVAPGAKLELYAANNVTVSSTLGVVNNTGIASNNKFYGLPTSTSWNLTSNDGTWIGTIYAPQANLSYTLNGENGYLHGAMVLNKFTLNGNINIHYDEALRNSSGASGAYSVASWQELRYVSGSWVP